MIRFRFIGEKKAIHPIHRLCKVMAVSQSGYYAWASRPASQRQRDDMVFLAYIRAEHSKSYRAYGRKRMTEELKDQGIVIGERRVARLMQDNLVRQSGEISSIDVNTIHENDQVEYVMGDDSRLTIRPNWTNRGAIIGAYAIARFKDGGIQRALMTREEIEEIRKASPSANSPAWKNHYGEMAKKTVFRRLCKMLPLSTEAQAAAGLADQADAGRIASVDSEMIIASEPEPTAEKPRGHRKAKKGEQEPAAEDGPPDGQVIEGDAQVVDDEPEKTPVAESAASDDAGEFF